ncbi:MAG: hypothetical protein EOO29_09555 [Comamonadaceae bacterium]|nr:MAG: hypothetical protein EOO29_09555 [Comamonadaceae bacterium]
MFSFLIRVILFFVGLLFAASLAVVALLLVAVWMARAGWSRLTGKPMTPWTVMFGNRFDPRAGFERFRAAAARQGGPTAADVAAARARGESVKSPIVNIGRGGDDVTDVRARPVGGRD